MKKSFIIIAAVCLALVACKKDYSCTCTETASYMGESETYTYTYKIEEASRTDARAVCSEATVVFEDSDGYTEKRTCELSK